MHDTKKFIKPSLKGFVEKVKNKITITLGKRS